MSVSGLVTEILANMAQRHNIRFTVGEDPLEAEEFFADDACLPILVGNVRNGIVDRELDTNLVDGMPFSIRASRASLAGYVLQADEVSFKTSHMLMLSALCWKSFEDLLTTIGHNGLLAQTRSGAYLVDMIDVLAVSKTLNGEHMGLEAMIQGSAPDARTPIFT
ncbi:hypothetical protein [Marinobacterium sp. BA1]|uniref:hypothetical protein n=1 Tax=Marinobacterium sp. BA1 TaxID=3138931 RepID=UPI0032E78D1E